MKAVIFIAAILCVQLALAAPDHTIMAPGKGGNAAKGETILQPKKADASTKPMTQAKVLKPESITQKCGCCHLETCACCPKKPEYVAPELKAEPAKCGCAPSCVAGTKCMCPNTCGCCKTHIQPEIKAEPVNACNCCHLDSCGCCKKEMVAPEQKEAHVAPEVVEKPKCPCAETKVTPCPCAK